MLSVGVDNYQYIGTEFPPSTESCANGRPVTFVAVMTVDNGSSPTSNLDTGIRRAIINNHDFIHILLDP